MYVCPITYHITKMAPKKTGKKAASTLSLIFNQIGLLQGECAFASNISRYVDDI